LVNQGESGPADETALFKSCTIRQSKYSLVDTLRRFYSKHLFLSDIDTLVHALGPVSALVQVFVSTWLRRDESSRRAERLDSMGPCDRSDNYQTERDVKRLCLSPFNLFRCVWV